MRILCAIAIVAVCQFMAAACQEQLVPGKSCNDIYQINMNGRMKSGYYWINTTTGVHQVYCDMELECGGHKGGWMRIANLNASRGDNCPTGWTKMTTNDAGQPSRVVCRSTKANAGCYSTSFTVNGTSYHKICGKARGYQKSSVDAFGGGHHFLRAKKDINGPYVDGLSITLGSPRKHVWTYAAGYSEHGTITEYTHYCPCAATPGAAPHPFIHDHYYCESGFAGSSNVAGVFYTSDPLWDGNGCAVANNNCCTDVGMPWFNRQFAAPQQDDIEARICTDQSYGDEAVAIDQLQLFIQ